jgi:HK97 family phage portal protein
MNYKKFFTWFGGNANTQTTGSQLSVPESSAHDDSPSMGVDGALQISSVWACVSIIVENLASLPLFVYQVGGDGSRQKLKDRLHSVFHDSPNAKQTSQEFWEQMLLNLVLRGNAYARISRNNKGEVISLNPLSADQMDVVLSDGGAILYEYYRDDSSLIYLENQILHIRGMGNGIIGLSPLDYMRSSVGLAVKAQNHTTKTFRKNARRPGILMSDSVLTQEQRKALKQNFGDIAAGSEKELYILEANFKFDPLGMSPADIQLLESRQFAVQDLARWFGVPSVLINDTSETTSLGSSVKEIIDGFYKLKLRPMVNKIEQAISKQVLTSQQRSSGINVEFNFDALLRSSLKDRMELYSKAVQNGLKTRNECRAKENDPALDGGDILTAQSNLLPLDKLGVQIQSGNVPEQPIEQ